MAWRIGLAAACVTMLAMAGAQAQDRSAWLKSQFSGWDGIAFYCDINANSGPTADKLCDWASQRVRILARQSGAPLTVLSQDRFQRWSERFNRKDKPLDLQLVIMGTNPTPGSVTAVHVAVRATHSAELPPDPKSTGPNPRAGTLVMWEMESIVSGMAGSELDGALQRSVETNLMKFLNDYADGQAK